MGDGYDAVVAGMGPAGAAAARELARAGANVLVLNHRPKRPKPCGGCVSARWRGLLEEWGPPAWFWEHPINRLWLTAPGAPPAIWSTSLPGGWFIARDRLDNFLAGRAQEAGAEALPLKAKGVQPQDGGWLVWAGDRTFTAEWLVCADGANGALSRSLGLGQRKTVLAALAEERPTPARLTPHLSEAALLELAGVTGGYGWIFCRGDTLNLGMGTWGASAMRGQGGLVKAYARFLARHGLGKPGAFRGWTIPCGGERRPRLVWGRACAVGDAAGLADPFLGEGIGQALYSGKLAARAILDGNLGHYQAALAGNLVKEQRQALMLTRLIFNLPGLAQRLVRGRPGALETGFDLLRGKLSYSRLWGRVGRKILGLKAELDPTDGGHYSMNPR